MQLLRVHDLRLRARFQALQKRESELKQQNSLFFDKNILQKNDTIILKNKELNITSKFNLNIKIYLSFKEIFLIIFFFMSNLTVY